MANNRVHRAYHGGALATTNVINGVTAGGLMTASVSEGFDDIVTAPHDGYDFPETDRLTAFCRGSITCQDWIEVLNVLNGTVGTYVFYEKESGAATVTSHTLLNPTIHQASISLAHRGRASATWAFECKAADANDTIGDLHAIVTAAEAPAATIEYSPGLEITAGTHGAGEASFYHIMGLTVNVQGNLIKASSDGDAGYTAVDVVWGGVPITGTLTIQDRASYQTLLTNTESNLVLTVKQCQGASDKTLTIKNVVFSGASQSANSAPGYTAYNLDFYVNGDQSSPLTLSGGSAAITLA